ncbi:MAG: sugar transferase [Gemmataceae bacterium]|nr:sugar transferase [Gemmataceae bacterium]
MRYGKRLFDLAVALPALILLAPLLVVLAVLVRLNLGAPVLFRQPRPGVGGRIFTLVKFRSMTDARDPDGNLLPDEQRLTRFGRFLRSTSLDELPELLNALCGQMSLVGPRPLLVQYLPYYSERERTRQDVRPGLTGWAQVNGRANLPWDERLEMDAWYVENCRLLLDLKILALTVWKVLRREDINADPALNIRYFDEERKQQSATPSPYPLPLLKGERVG